VERERRQTTERPLRTQRKMEREFIGGDEEASAVELEVTMRGSFVTL